MDREREGVSRHVALRTSAALLLTTVYYIRLPGEVLFLIFVFVKVASKIVAFRTDLKTISCVIL